MTNRYAALEVPTDEEEEILREALDAQNNLRAKRKDAFDHYLPNITDEQKAKFNSFESLDYDDIHSENNVQVKLSVRERRLEMSIKWAFLLITGICIGVTAVALDFAVGNLLMVQRAFYLELIWDHPFLSYLCSILFSSLLVGSSAFLCTVVAPKAGGSGFPEMKSYLNGVNLHGFLSWKTYIVKVIALFLAQSGEVVIGKEGPLIHIGCMVAARVANVAETYRRKLIPATKSSFSTDHDKRDFVAAGAAAGVAAAFGAPVGGVLVALEEVSSFWSLKTIWRTFFTAIVSASTATLILTLIRIQSVRLSGLVVLGGFSGGIYEIWELVPFAMIGVVGGVLGLVYIQISVRINRFRRDYVNTYRSLRIAEAVLIAILTSTFVFWMPAFFPCNKLPKHQQLNVAPYKQYLCSHGHYNQMATLTFNNQAAAVKSLLHTNEPFDMPVLFAFGLMYFFLATITTGIAVPGGVFIPTILAGCCIGRIIGRVVQVFVPVSTNFNLGVYSLLGASSMLGGVSQMTISMAVILTELTDDTEYLGPIMLTILISRGISSKSTESLLERLIGLKSIPYLPDDPSPLISEVEAVDRIEEGEALVVLKEVETVESILHVLKSDTHNGYPVVGACDKEDGETHPPVVGLMLRAHLWYLLKNRVFGRNPDVSDIGFISKDDPEENVFTPSFSSSEMAQEVDLRPFMNKAPFLVQESVPYERIARYIRGMGLRHVIIVDQQTSPIGIVCREDLLDYKFRKLVVASHRRVLKEQEQDRLLAMDSDASELES